MDRVEFVELVTDTLDQLGYEYTQDVLDTTGGEKYMLGAGEEGDEITVGAPEPFIIQVVTATSDPGVGYALKFFATKEKREEMTAGACVVDIQDVTEATRPYIAQVMTRIIEQSDTPPWDVTHHVGLRIAFLLRWKMRILWKYWLRTDLDPAIEAT